MIVPAADAAEASLVPGMRVTGVRSLRELVALARGQEVTDDLVAPYDDPPEPPPEDDDDRHRPDLADVARAGDRAATCWRSPRPAGTTC